MSKGDMEEAEALIFDAVEPGFLFVPEEPELDEVTLGVKLSALAAQCKKKKVPVQAVQRTLLLRAIREILIDQRQVSAV